MKALAALALTVATVAAQTSSHPGNLSVTAVRSWSVGEVVRVAIEVSGDFEYHTERLHNPERVYYDVFRARPNIESRRIYTKVLTGKMVQRIRVAETLPDVTRVVLDIGADVEVSASRLANPIRLVIEIRPPGGGAAPPEKLAAPVPATDTRRRFVPPPATARVTPVPAVPAPGRATLKSEARTEVPTRLKDLLKTQMAEAPRPEEKVAPTPPRVQPSVESMAIRADARGADLVPETSKSALPAGPEPVRIAAGAPIVAGPAEPRPAVREEPGKAAKRNGTGQNSLIRALGLKINRVVIDPGHGGHDQGTEGPKGLLEKDLVLDVALRLGKMIQERMGAEVVYTRTDDTFVPLEGRTALANEKKADLFLSIHANSSSIPKIAGVETFYLNFTGSQDGMDVAARENASSQKSVFELRDLIQKITLHDKAEESKEFAGKVQASLFSFSVRNVPGSKNRGVKRAPFIVLIGATMPSVLAEIGFLSNPREEALLKKADYRQKLADALFRGVSRYADGLSHFQMAQSQ